MSQRPLQYPFNETRIHKEPLKYDIDDYDHSKVVRLARLADVTVQHFKNHDKRDPLALSAVIRSLPEDSHQFNLQAFCRVLTLHSVAVRKCLVVYWDTNFHLDLAR